MEFICRDLGVTDYQATLSAMQTFTKNRTATTQDELWLTAHYSVYTLGLNHTDERLPFANKIPTIQSDRGGKITYHGLGQVIIYVLIDLKRRNLKVRELVNRIESSIVELLQSFNVVANTKKEAPGVYVHEAKIASLGLRIKNKCCYHGLSLNVDMDLSPFLAIDPCGYQGLLITQTKALGIAETPQALGKVLMQILQKNCQHDWNKTITHKKNSGA